MSPTVDMIYPAYVRGRKTSPRVAWRGWSTGDRIDVTYTLKNKKNLVKHIHCTARVWRKGFIKKIFRPMHWHC